MRKLTGKCKWILAVLIAAVSMAAGCNKIKATDVKIIQKASLDYPLQNKRQSFEYLREIAHLRPRTNTFAAVFRVRSVASFAIHKFLNLHFAFLNHRISHHSTSSVFDSVTKAIHDELFTDRCTVGHLDKDSFIESCSFIIFFIHLDDLTYIERFFFHEI